jgi:hypothetical protein
VYERRKKNIWLFGGTYSHASGDTRFCRRGAHKAPGRDRSPCHYIIDIMCNKSFGFIDVEAQITFVGLKRLFLGVPAKCAKLVASKIALKFERIHM